MLRCLVLLAAAIASVAAHSDPWGENLTPRLRVNYLSQKSGKHRQLANSFLALWLLFDKFPIVCVLIRACMGACYANPWKCYPTAQICMPSASFFICSCLAATCSVGGAAVIMTCLARSHCAIDRPEQSAAKNAWPISSGIPPAATRKLPVSTDTEQIYYRRMVRKEESSITRGFAISSRVRTFSTQMRATYGARRRQHTRERAPFLT